MLITTDKLALHPIPINESFRLSELMGGGEEFRQVDPLSLAGVAELIRGEIRIRGRLRTRVEGECARCVSKVQLTLDREFDLVYRPVSTIAREEEIEIPRDELEVGFYAGAGVDTADLAREQILLSIPMKVVCRPECLGLCPTCGANRNLETCACREAPQGSPFAVLLGE